MYNDGYTYQATPKQNLKLMKKLSNTKGELKKALFI